MDQILKDRLGYKIGTIRTEGSKLVLYDALNYLLGYFDGKCTYDNHGYKIGEGNLLTTLL